MANPPAQPGQAAPPGYITKQQAAEAFGVSERTIRLWYAQGRIKGERFGDPPGAEVQDRRPLFIHKSAIKKGIRKWQRQS